MAAMAIAISAGGALSFLETTVLLTVEKTLIADEALRIVGARNPRRLGDLIDRAFGAASDEAGVRHRPGVEDNGAVPQDKLAVGPAGSL
jgi:hypothetical protein